MACIRRAISSSFWNQVCVLSQSFSVQLFFIFFCIYDDRFSFDPSRPAGSRVIEAKLLAPERDIDVAKTYTLGTKLYVAEGHDGCK